MLKGWGIFLGVACALAGCNRGPDHKGKTPLVEVAGEYLYEEDLRTALPPGISKDDSVSFAERYIQNWVKDALLFDKAEGNIPDNDKINRLVGNYRRTLIMHAYQEELVNQRLGNEISEEEVAAYYVQNKRLFRAEVPYVKGLFIKVPLRAPDLGNVRAWYKKNSRDAIENLEKYSLSHAVSYDYFYDRWVSVSDLAAKMPLNTGSDEMGTYLNKNQNLEVKDTAFVYFLHVEEFLDKGEQRPLDFARDEIKEILINLKRVEFINGVKDDLYRYASEKNKITYYY